MKKYNNEKILWDFEFGTENEKMGATVEIEIKKGKPNFRKAAKKFCKKQFGKTDEKITKYIIAKMDEGNENIKK